MLTFAGDFETTTKREDCRVWAYGLCEIGNPDNFIYGNSLDDFMSWAKEKKKLKVYFHNLKFDGEFIINWLFRNGYSYCSNRKMLTANTFSTLISDKGQFYSLEICFKKKGKNRESLVIYDSLKIIPFSVDAISECFNLPCKKLKIDYHEEREIGHELTDEEVDYLRNDVEICARALDVLFSQGLTQMTQGSNALEDYKATVGKRNFKRWFPILDFDIDKDIRQSYKGGFTYLNPKFKNQEIEDGIVLDVNSLYPSVMYSKPLPYGEPKFFEGKYQKDELYPLYIQMFRCAFTLKEGYIPTVQLKNNLSFVPTEYLNSSNGEEITLCMTNVDLEIFLEHYDIDDIEYFSGWKFKATVGLFKDYIDKWIKVKIESTRNGNKGMRTLSKLMLNALYGKFALNPVVRSKHPYFQDEMVKYREGEAETRDAIYIPVGTFVTSWARSITINAAQSVYDRFVYSDTDSIHLQGTELPEELWVDDVELGAWKLESTFVRARFLRQKAYIEDTIVTEKEIDKTLEKHPEWIIHVSADRKTMLKITCAGLPDRCYEYVTWDNFKPKSQFKGKLMFKHVSGGIILEDILFTIKE